VRILYVNINNSNNTNLHNLPHVYTEKPMFVEDPIYVHIK